MLLILIVKDVNTKDEIFFVTLLEIFFSVEGSYFAVVKSYAFKWIQTRASCKILLGNPHSKKLIFLLGHKYNLVIISVERRHWVRNTWYAIYIYRNNIAILACLKHFREIDS